MKRRLTVSLVFLLAIGLCGGLVWFNFFRDKMIAAFFATMQPPPQTVAAMLVETKTWTPGIPAIGTARAQNGVELAVETTGVVRQINIKPNQRFAKGDVLLQLDDAVDRADLADAQAAVKLSEANYERSNSLQQKGFATPAAFDQTVAQLASARARLARLEAVIDLKSLDAPFSGVAGIVRVDPGQFLQAGTVVATFQDISSMKVDFKIPEQMAEKLKVGQPVRLGFAEDDLRFAGKVAGVDPRVDPQTRLIAVQAILADNRHEAVLPGQFLHVRIELPPEPNVVTVPQTAVISSLYGDYVYLVEPEEKDGKTRQVVKQVFVKAGRRDGGQFEIRSGIQPGQTVVVSGQNKLQAGGTVLVDNSIDVTKLARGN
jgi:membrane fusion protein (multidrug efflux system)